MKLGRGQFLLALSVSLSLCLALLVALGGYFRSVERNSSGGRSEKKLVAQLRGLHDQFRQAESPEQAKVALRGFESTDGFGPESEGLRELKKAAAPVLAAFGNKPREAEAHHLLAKKRDLMDLLVNSYRKEIPHGDIRVRAAYLNILFDVQGSLLNENDETEMVFIKRNRERTEQLKGLVASGGDGTLPGRVGAVDQALGAYEKAFTEATKWRGSKAETIAKAEQELPGLAKRILAAEEAGLDETRRYFLYVCLGSLVVALASLLALFIGYKVLRVRAEVKMEDFTRYLRSFGHERADPQTDRAVAALKEDPVWAPVVVETQRAEQQFLQQHQTLIAIPRALQAPYLVFGKDKALKLWNENASRLFGLTQGKEWGLQDLLREGVLRPLEGEHEALAERLQGSHSGLSNERIEVAVRQGSDWLPFELITNPISSGPMSGGRVYLWREICSETERLERALALQLSRARDIVRKISGSMEAQIEPAPGDAEAVKDIILELDSMRRRLNEKELLWKSETQALTDQVTRQQEVLRRLAEELEAARLDYAEVQRLLRAVMEGDENWHDEVCAIERDLERWTGNRRRLLQELGQQGIVLQKARNFEEQLRLSTEAVKKALESYESDLHELREFAEAARVHAVNISLVRDPGYWEFASRSRTFAQNLMKFTDKAAYLSTKVREFLAGHPGGALAAHLDSSGVDGAVVEALAEEQERISTCLKRWRESGQTILAEGEKALELLATADKKNVVITQLGETSLLINEQAQGNLGRWN